MVEQPFLIVPARTQADMISVRELFVAYSESIDTDLCFQGFDEELATLPGQYEPPRGEILLALDESGEAIGCIAMRSGVGDGVCEMKRLFVSPEGRGRGLGSALIKAIIGVAVAAGYAIIQLDTLPTMVEAQRLYSQFGFEVVDPYYETPVVGTVFMSRKLMR